ncbi:hypothetical protein J6590_003292 [Homalodisca vitripennis]|nr:hypothetical protein J6590_003292 [Homalodisca vitripennis]
MHKLWTIFTLLHLRGMICEAEEEVGSPLRVAQCRAKCIFSKLDKNLIADIQILTPHSAQSSSVFCMENGGPRRIMDPSRPKRSRTQTLSPNCWTALSIIDRVSNVH